MSSIEFFIPGLFKAKGRPRFSKAGFTYTPNETESYEAVVRQYAKEAMAGKPPMEGPLEAQVDFTFPRPKSKKLDIYHISRPDCDNMIKTIFDAINQIVFRDDSQVCSCAIVKYLERPTYLDLGITPVGVMVRVYQLEDTKFDPPQKPPKPERKKKGAK